MSMCRTGIACLVLLAGQALADEAIQPQLGEVLSDEAVDAIDYVILPDGSGLPPGSGNASVGEALYGQHCIACHGPEGENGINDRLAGGHGTITTELPVRTVGSYWPYATTVFDYIRRAMPYTDPGSLDADEVYALTAYLLYINGIVDAEDRIDAESLPAVRMPNQDSFVWAYTPAEPPD